MKKRTLSYLIRHLFKDEKFICEFIYTPPAGFPVTNKDDLIELQLRRFHISDDRITIPFHSIGSIELLSAQEEK